MHCLIGNSHSSIESFRYITKSSVRALSRVATSGSAYGDVQVRGRVKDANLPKPTQVHLVSCMKEIGVKKLLQSLVELVRPTVAWMGCLTTQNTACE